MIAARADALRAIAAFEALKGVVVVVAGFGLLGLLHRDVRHVAVEMVDFFHLSHDGRYSHFLLAAADRLGDMRLMTFAVGAVLYSTVRFIEAFVEGLDLAALGFTKAVAKETGRPGYAPGDLLRLYLYGYLNRVRSSRLLERETQRNVEVMWLVGKLTPDFKTIADFRKDNLQALRAYPDNPDLIQ